MRGKTSYNQGGLLCLALYEDSDGARASLLLPRVANHSNRSDELFVLILNWTNKSPIERHYSPASMGCLVVGGRNPEGIPVLITMLVCNRVILGLTRVANRSLPPPLIPKKIVLSQNSFKALFHPVDRKDFQTPGTPGHVQFYFKPWADHIKAYLHQPTYFLLWRRVGAWKLSHV